MKLGNSIKIDANSKYTGRFHEQLNS